MTTDDHAFEATIPDLAGVSPTRTRPEPTKPVDERRPPRRGSRRALLAAGAAVAVVVAGGGGWALANSGGGSDPAPPGVTAGVDVASATTALDVTSSVPSRPVVGGELIVDGPRIATVGEAVTFRATAPAGVETFTWRFGDEERLGPVVTFAWDGAGSRPVSVRGDGPGVVLVRELTVEVTDAAADTADPAIEVRDAEATDGLRADFGWSPEVPGPGQPLRFEDRSEGGASSWEWRWANNSVATSRNPNLSTALSIDTPVTLRVCRDQARVECDSITKTIPVG